MVARDMAPPHAIDVSRPIAIYDNRGKTDEKLRVTSVLFVKGARVLCEARFASDDTLHTVLFDRNSREVLTANFAFWSAENIEEPREAGPVTELAGVPSWAVSGQPGREAWPKVPPRIVQDLVAYGDARTEGGATADYWLQESVVALRQWAAELQQTSESGVAAADGCRPDSSCPPQNWAHQALQQLDVAMTLVTWASVSMPDVPRYYRGLAAFNEVVRLLRAERARLAGAA